MFENPLFDEDKPQPDNSPEHSIDPKVWSASI